MSNAESDRKPDDGVEDDDEPDEWFVRCCRIAMRNGVADGRQGQENLQHWLLRCVDQSGGRLLQDAGLMRAHSEENTALNDCFYEKKDWRACKDEVSGCGRYRWQAVSWSDKFETSSGRC